MQQIRLQSSEQVSYTVCLPPPSPKLASCYFFAFAKSGSTLVDKMLADYCNACGHAYFSLFGQAFSQGVTTSSIQADAMTCFYPVGYVYSGFRHYPAFDLPIEKNPVVLLVRDPRDMLVSLYFSIAKSHVIPTPESRLAKERAQVLAMDLQDFVITRAPGYVSQLNRYQHALANANLLEIRYEDGIYNKKSMLQNIIEHFGIPLKRRLLQSISANHDIIPSQENEDAHIRQVHPGNFRKKLEPATIKRLNNILAPFLERYNYPMSES